MACATRTAHLVDFVEPLPYMEILVQRKGICALVAPPAVLLLLFATRNDFADKDGVQYVALTDDGVYDWMSASTMAETNFLSAFGSISPRCHRG